MFTFGKWVPRNLMRETIILQESTVTVDSTGFSVVSFADAFTVKAAVQEQAGSEQNLAGKEMSVRQYKVYLASQDFDVSSPLLESSRIKWVAHNTTRYLGILNVRDYDSQRRITELTCHELLVGADQV